MRRLSVSLSAVSVWVSASFSLCCTVSNNPVLLCLHKLFTLSASVCAVSISVSAVQLRIQLCLTGCSKSFSPSFSSCCSVLDSALLIHLSYTFGSTPAVPVCVSAVQFRFLPSSFKYCSDSIVVPRLSISVSAIENQLLKISFRYCSADNIVINLSFSVFAVCGPNLSSNMASC
jgi:hypothetical protein